MFTGIVEEIGSISRIVPSGSGQRVEISAHTVLEGTAIGESISVNGVCLTVVERNTGSFSVDVVEETLKKSTLGGFRAGDDVNLERALAANGRFGGHFVQGHIDTFSRILSLQERQGSWWLAISFAKEHSKFIIERGSIAVDGVSLTIAEKETDALLVSIIPQTYHQTIFRRYKPGTFVNIEFDMLGKYIVNILELQAGTSSISMDYVKLLGY